MDVEIKIRAEGGSMTGFGHWSRCLFLMSCADSTIKKKLYSFNTTEFKQFFDFPQLELITLNDEQDFINEISRGDIIILDGYGFDSAYLKLIKSREAIIVYIDDLLYAGIDADVIINHCPGLKSADYVDPSPSVSFFLGGSYNLVASSKVLSNQLPDKERIHTLLIAMGGADPFDFTSKILNDYSEWIKTFRRIIVIVGGTHPHLKELTQFIESETDIELYVSVSKDRVRNLMNSAGVAILSSSTMALEYAQIRGVLGIIQSADNQKNLYRGLIESGGAIDIQNLINSIDMITLYHKIVPAQEKLIDGKSAERFSRMFTELTLQSKMKLRRATLNDTELTFEWASDNAIRMFSFSRHEISREKHTSWFEKKMIDDNTLYFIAEIEKKDIGSIRFDISSTEKEAVLSYLVDPLSQGQGLGRVLLAEGIKELQKANLQVEWLVGYVLRANRASLRIFERMGFLQENADTKYPDSIKFYKRLK